MPVALSPAERLAWWGTSWLRGHIGPDELLDAVIGADVTHVVDGDSLLAGLMTLRAHGASSFGAAFPVEGDPVGLGGPAPFNLAALEQGEAIVVIGTGRGLVPRPVGPTVEWTSSEARPRQVPDIGATDRELRLRTNQAIDALVELDVARWRPEVADLLMNRDREGSSHAPAGVPQRCVTLAARASLAAVIVDLALQDDGGALSVNEADRRRQALQPLGRAARHALVAAFSPEAWPPE